MSTLKLLVIGGHPADVFDHCGGTMAHHVRRGDQVTALALTQGLRIHDQVISEQMRFQTDRPDREALDRLIQERASNKYAEVIQACQILGVHDVRFLDDDDQVLLVSQEIIVKVARVIRNVRPDLVITHYPLENAGIESHHGNTGRIVIQALELAGKVDYADPALPHRVAQVYFMAPLEATFMSTCLSGHTTVFCDFFVDIGDVASLKVQALDAMKSQQYEGAYARKVVECWNGKDGHYMGVSYAEGFVRYLPEIGDYLFVSNERLSRANEPEITTRIRSSRLDVPFI
jgi:4-oxalomesaconate hydratase